MSQDTRVPASDAEAWEIYVGDQTVRDFLDFGGIPRVYMNEMYPDLPPWFRESIAEMIQQYIEGVLDEEKTNPRD